MKLGQEKGKLGQKNKSVEQVILNNPIFQLLKNYAEIMTKITVILQNF